MNKKILALLLALSLVLCACAYDSGEDEGSYVSVYRTNASDEGGGALLVREQVACAPDEDPVGVMLASLNSKPAKPYLGRAFPDGVRARECDIENGLARVSMSEEFARLGETQRLICCSALTLTLCTLDGVCAVNVECEGVVYAEGLRPEDIHFADAVFEEHERSVKLFLPAEGMDKLSPRSYDITVTAEENAEALIARAVLENLPVYTEPTAVLSARTEDGICTLDLSEAFYGNEPADSVEGMLMLYSLVNSLCRLNNVEGLVITVEGQTVVSYGGYRASWPLSARDSLVIY